MGSRRDIKKGGVRVNLTREESIANFRAHWMWLSENPKVDKWGAPNVKGKGLFNNCFLCEYSFNPAVGDVDCKKCPINWSSSRKKFMCELGFGLYGQWSGAIFEGDYDSAAELALQIANLPEREVQHDRP